LKCISLELPFCTGFILNLLSDNTTALSWTHVAATTPIPALQQLARFASALLVQATRLLTSVQPSHIPGIPNEEADTLSCHSNLGKFPRGSSLSCSTPSCRPVESASCRASCYPR
jgi:hypothetical protein